MKEDNPFLPPPQERADANYAIPTTYLPIYGLLVAAKEFHKLYELKVNKLKSAYSAMANLIFKLWFKDIRVYVEDKNP